MKLITQSIPDRTEDLASWLEREIMGLQLRDIVVELAAFQQDAPLSPTLEEALGNDLPDVLVEGLTVLSDRRLRELLRYPRLLLDLQERIFIEGGPYWTNLEVDESLQEASSRVWVNLKETLKSPPVRQSEPKLSGELDAVDSSSAAPRKKNARGNWNKSTGNEAGSKSGRFFAVIMTAALLLGLTLFLQRSAGPQWGLDRPSLLSSNQPKTEFYRAIATTVEQDWTPERTEDPEALAASLADFRHGCDTLLDAPLSNLSEQDRNWLKDRCGKWREKIVGHLADLESGDKPFETVRTEADATVNRLITVLREEAQKV